MATAATKLFRSRGACILVVSSLEIPFSTTAGDAAPAGQVVERDLFRLSRFIKITLLAHEFTVCR